MATVVGVEGSDMLAGGEFEKANGAINESASEVGMGQGEATACQPIRYVNVGGIKVEGVVIGSPNAKISSRPMTVNVLVSPRGVHEVGMAPYDRR
ncbi:hypothetical protein V6N13_071802 [Hibiscus sabdariffa]|uniref:Uncharacterized protein n=1 Tax=Hibiscus sabdariffa TaxID=183260 RepID=A0ABR2TCC3_9ROSI